jgi:hypothetical protein
MDSATTLFWCLQEEIGAGANAFALPARRMATADNKMRMVVNSVF